MKWNISGASIPFSLPYAVPINRAAIDTGASPMALYAIAWRETIGGERSGWLDSAYPGMKASTIISPDGGHGLFQLTAEYPADWNDPYTNAVYGSTKFYEVYLKDWLDRGYSGGTLLRLAADDFNAGDVRVLLWHGIGNADGATTGGNYGTDVETIYNNLVAGRDPDVGRPL